MCGFTATNRSLRLARVFYSFAPRLGKRMVRLLPVQSADLVEGLTILLAEQSIELAPEVSHFATDPQVQHVYLGTA